MMYAILFALITFVFVLWPTKKAAEWFEAENTGYGSVIMELLLSMVLVVIAAFAAIPLAFLGIGGYILIVVMMFYAVGYAYSKMLGTSIGRGIGISLVAGIIGGIMQFVLSLIFGVSMFGKEFDGELSWETLEESSDVVCQCGTDQACLEEKFEEFSLMLNAASEQGMDQERLGKIAEPTFMCVLNPKPYKPRRKPASTAVTIPDPVPAPAQEPVQEEPAVVEEKTITRLQPVQPEADTTPAEFAWRSATVEELPALIDKEVKIETLQGMVREGVLTGIDEFGARIRKSRNLSFSVPLDQVKSIQVYDQAGE